VIFFQLVITVDIYI